MMRSTCLIDSGWWMNFGLNDTRMSASSSGVRDSWTAVGSCGANTSVIRLRVNSAKASISGTRV